jgi:anti-sigma B factor antagonist
MAPPVKSALVVRVAPRQNDAAQVVLEGPVDAHTFEQFRKASAELIEGGTLWLVLDLRAMTYIASVGINYLINLRVQRRKAGGEVILVGPQPAVYKILKMLGLLEVLVVSPTLEEAWTTMRAKIQAAGGKSDGDVPLIGPE